ncbi:ras association domain-containing protein 3 isoform X3 [Anguilla rostrata]|uniref:ras association domain-containing protein 3 isoform X3 n=1 Tax=Anguilla rostrata TaxID=7938 RepID=UPI0030CE1C7F
MCPLVLAHALPVAAVSVLGRSGGAGLGAEGREGERTPALGTWFGMGTAICKLSGKITQQVKRRSTGCKYTCHPQCRSRVSLDCHQSGPAPQSQDHLNNNRNSSVDVEKEKELRAHLSREEIGHKVELYNAAVRDHLKMTLNPSGLYTGFIKVQLELLRPITVRGGGGGGPAGSPRTHPVSGEEAFFMPRGTVNTLHISSSNTVRQVIEALLHKFTVADNPAKFALFKRYRREDQVYVCKLAEEEHPLFLRLVAGPNTDTLSFVLREQQTGEVMWDAFSIPELQNFLRILHKEEDDQVQVLTRRYANYREKLEEALRAVGNHG